MANDYARVVRSIWADDDFRELSHHAQWLYFHLLTSPALNYAGVTDWRPSRIAALTGDMDAQAVEAAAAELETNRYILVDRGSEEALVRTFIRHDGLMKTPNVAAAMTKAYAGTVSKPLREAIIHELKRLHHDDPTLRGWAHKNVKELLKLGSQKGSDNPSTKGSDKGSDNPSEKGCPTPSPAPSPSPPPPAAPSEITKPPAPAKSQRPATAGEKRETPNTHTPARQLAAALLGINPDHPKLDHLPDVLHAHDVRSPAAWLRTAAANGDLQTLLDRARRDADPYPNMPHNVEAPPPGVPMPDHLRQQLTRNRKAQP